MKIDLSIFKFVVFLFGLVVIGFASILCRDYISLDTAQYILLCLNITSIYVLFFLPTLIAKFSRKDADRTFVGGGVYYCGLTVYAIASIGLIYAIFNEMPFKLGILIQLVVIFIMLTYVYLACFTVEHIENVQKEEAIKKSDIIYLRNKLQDLAVISNGLGDEYSEISNSINKLSDEARYLSPSDSDEAKSLEEKMILLVETMINDDFFKSKNNQSKAFVLERISDMQILMKQRKNKY